jgi:hypothetical protein
MTKITTSAVGIGEKDMANKATTVSFKIHAPERYFHTRFSSLFELGCFWSDEDDSL